MSRRNPNADFAQVRLRKLTYNKVITLCKGKFTTADDVISKCVDMAMPALLKQRQHELENAMKESVIA
jgi:hypothetical protein